MLRLATLCVVPLLLLSLSVAQAEEPSTAELVAPRLRLVHIVDGLRSQPKNRELRNTQQTSIYKTAKAAGVDLESPAHPLAVASYENDRLFYVFYKIAEGLVGDRPYVVQRIKKTERAWATADQEQPDVRTTYQVEVFKTFAGALKRADEHHGSYGLGENHRREIVKEYEIGFGEVPGLCEGTDWPFDDERLFEYVQKYQEDPGVHPDVEFFAATPWSLHVEFGADGAWAVRCPELDIDVPGALPDPKSGIPAADPASRGVVLAAGRGPDGLVLEKSTLPDLVELYGKPVQTQVFPSGSANHWFGGGLVFNVNRQGKLNTVLTLPGFSGRTKAGVRHGDPRHEVLAVMGMPKPAMTNAWTWKYDGVLFYFDGYDRVSRIVLFD